MAFEFAPCGFVKSQFLIALQLQLKTEGIRNCHKERETAKGPSSISIRSIFFCVFSAMVVCEWT